MSIFNRKKKNKEYEQFANEIDRLLLANAVLKGLFESNIKQLEDELKNNEDEMINKRVMLGALELTVGHLENVESFFTGRDN